MAEDGRDTLATSGNVGRAGTAGTTYAPREENQLENKGWRFRTVQEFLVLSTADAASVEDRLQSVAGVGRRGRARKAIPRLGARKSTE
jgi:hypothetical protein